jgi:hypothetical protein
LKTADHSRQGLRRNSERCGHGPNAVLGDCYFQNVNLIHDLSLMLGTRGPFATSAATRTLAPGSMRTTGDRRHFSVGPLESANEEVGDQIKP